MSGSSGLSYAVPYPGGSCSLCRKEVERKRKRFDGGAVVVFCKAFQMSRFQETRSWDLDEIGRLGWGDQAVARSFGDKPKSREHFAGFRLGLELL